jgi:hypothetical protein
MFRRLAMLLGLSGVIGLVVRTIGPDVRRYLKIRKM